MSLLVLEHVTKRARRRGRASLVLKDVTLRVEGGEQVSVWGLPGSGRTMLLQVAAGIERPDDGVVEFDGKSLTCVQEHRNDLRLVQPYDSALPRRRTLSHVAMPLLARGVSPEVAHTRASELLERMGVLDCADVDSGELDGSERVKVGLAEALITKPRLLLVDDPTFGVDSPDRPAIYRLLRAIADSGVAVLMTTGEAMGVAGVDRALSMSNGQIHRQVTFADAEIIPLHGPTSGSGQTSRPVRFER